MERHTNPLRLCKQWGIGWGILMVTLPCGLVQAFNPVLAQLPPPPESFRQAQSAIEPRTVTLQSIEITQITRPEIEQQVQELRFPDPSAAQSTLPSLPSSPSSPSSPSLPSLPTSPSSPTLLTSPSSLSSPTLLTSPTSPSSPTLLTSPSSLSSPTSITIQDLVGRTFGREQLKQLLIDLSDRVTQLYLRGGFITSRAILVEPSLDTGKIEIRVFEGRLAAIEVEGNQHLSDQYIRSRVALGLHTPLNTTELEEQLRLLKTDPLIEDVDPTLKPTGDLGESILVIKVVEAQAWGVKVFSDNYSPPSIGSEQVGVEVFHRNLSGIGDELVAAYQRSTIGASETVDFSYKMPLNALGGTLQLRGRYHDDQIAQDPFDQFDFRGESERYEIQLYQPIFRSLRQELALSLGFTFQEGQTFTFAGPTPFSIGPDEAGVSRTSVFKFGQYYTRRDPGGSWTFASQIHWGTELFEATNNPSPIPDSQFLSWLLQAQRLQVLSPDNFLILQADLQLATDSLLPSEQFVIGGGQSVRGYRQNSRAGDNGWRVSVEDRITVWRNARREQVMQLAPFVDLGSVWNVKNNPNTLPDQRLMVGLGAGLLWQPVQGFNLRFDYGFPIVDLDDRGENIQDHGLYFNVNYSNPN